MTLAVPLAVRLKTSRSDVHVTKELRNLSFRSVVPGGFASCEIALTRAVGLDPDEIRLYGDLVVYDGRNGSTVWQGRLEDPGRGAGPQGEVWTIRALGPSAHARDRTIPIVYVERSLERWFPYLDPGDGTVVLTHPDAQHSIGDDLGGSGALALVLRMPKSSSIITNSLIGREYRQLREFGQKLARFDYTWDAGVTFADWKAEMMTRGTGGDGIRRAQNFDTAGSGAQPKVVVTDFPNGNDLLEVRQRWAGAAATTSGENDWLSVMNLVVLGMRFGKDGVEKTSGYTTNTVLASSVVEDLLGRLLNKFDGADARVDATTFAIEQLAYHDGASAEQILGDLMALEGDFYWAAWEHTASSKNRFEWRAWPTTVRYEAAASDGEFDAPGSVAELFNRVQVHWRDQNGRIRSNLRTNTVAVLTDAGLTREALLDLGDEVGSSTAADRAGDDFLAAHALPLNAGTLTVRRSILDFQTGRRVQPWEIRPGGLIRVRDVKPRIDALNPTGRDGVTVFQVIASSYDAGDNSAQLELDSTLRGVAAPRVPRRSGPAD